MVEAEPRGVQELALQAVPPPRAVFRVPGDGMPDRCEVDSDLVGAPGLQARMRQGVGPQRLDHLEVGSRLSGSRSLHRPLRALPAVAAERGIDRAGAAAE